VTEAAFAVLALLVLGWALTSDLLARVNVNGPLVFLAAGYALGNPDWGPLSAAVGAPSIHLLAEMTLALLLFAVAARVNVSEFRADIYLLARQRRLLNVESGLNDGIVTPIVAFMLAVAASQLGIASHGDSAGGGALPEVATDVAVGLAVGLGSAFLISFGSRRHWVMTGGRRPAALAAALSSFALTVALDGNGFIAALVAGISFGAERDQEVARCVPVAISLLGTGLNQRTVLFVGWFGPPGLPSIVFALLAVEELGETAEIGTAIAAVSFTVLSSVVLHGMSAGPLAGLDVRDEQGHDEPGDAPRSRRRGHRLGVLE
jgi:NhaP-type Na+/H+ or K+/H+ antiporter